MARKRIGRRVTETTYLVGYYDNENEFHDVQLKLYGQPSLETAQNKFKKELGINRLMVKEILSIKTFYASMTLDEFVKYADKIED